MFLTRRQLLAGFGASAIIGGVSHTAQAQSAGLGAVMIHGKRDSAWGSLSSTASALSGAGIKTISPEMPWSSSRYLTGTWSDAMAEIGQAVATLRGQGATRIVLVGHSLGCPAAMSYAASRSGVAALVLTAPGHSPAGFYKITPEVRYSVDRARAMVKSGRGNEVTEFADNNQGNVFSVRASAAQYLSYFDPKGPCEMRNTAGRIGCPALWVVGTNDSVVNWGGGIGRQVTRRPKSLYLEIPGANHRSTPSAASSEIVQWLARI